VIRPYEDLTSVRLEPVERLMCFDSLSTNGSNQQAESIVLMHCISCRSMLRSDIPYRYNNNFNARLNSGTDEFHDFIP